MIRWLEELGPERLVANLEVAVERYEAMAPDTPHDVAAALAWVHAHAAEYGGDPDRIAIMGHSAGAHLAGVLPHRRQGGENRDKTGLDVARVLTTPTCLIVVLKMQRPKETGNPTLK